MIGALGVGAGIALPNVAATGLAVALGGPLAAWLRPHDPHVIRGALRGLLPVGLGVLLVAGRAAAAGAPLTDPGAARLPGTATYDAVVESVGSPKGDEQLALIQIESATSGPNATRIEAVLPRYPTVGAGDSIRVSGRLEPPGQDDFGAFLRRLGAAGSLRSPTLEVVAGPAGPGGLLEWLRRGSADLLVRALPEPQAGLADGILIGLRDRVDRGLAAAFTTAGVSHIVAISGWNIAIVAALVAAVLGARVGRLPRTAITLATIVGYTLVAGASPSVSRAALMAAIGLIARASGRSSSALSALGWAVIVLLAIDPAIVTDPGFALSGLATAGLIAWTTPLSIRLALVRGHRLPGWLAESLAISLAAEAATLPVVLLIFGRLAIVAPLANLVIVPIVPSAMAAGAVALGAGWLGALGLPEPIVIVLGLPAWALLGLMISLVRLAASLPLASVTLPPPWNIAAALVALAILGLAVGGRRLVGRAGVRAIPRP